MASSSSPSDPALPPPEPAPSPVAPPPMTEVRPKPSPTVADNVRGLLRSGEAFIRGAFRGKSGLPTPPRPQQQQQHHNRPADIMKHLQHETFPDVMKLLDKHEQIEHILSMYKSGKEFHFPDLPIRVKVSLDAVGALFLVDDNEFEQARQILDKAGIRTGLSSRFVFESKTRGEDTISAELSTRFEAGAHLGEATGRPLELTRMQYCTHINDWLSMTLIPFGAQCNNFLHDSSLIQNLRSQASFDGPPSFSEHHNCAAGLSIKRSKFTASIAELIYGSGAQDSDHGVANRMTTFGQVSYEPADDVKLSLSGLWQICPSSSRFNNLGTLAVPFGILKPRKYTPPPPPPTPPPSPPPPAPHQESSVMVQLPAPPAPLTPMAPIGPTVMDLTVHGPPPPAPAAATGLESWSSKSMAVMLDCEMYETMKAEGWVQMERPNHGAVHWGFCLSDTPEHELGWGVRMGGTSTREKHHQHLEGFLSFNLGKGAKLQPGLVYVMEGAKRTPALVLRSSWFM